MKALTILTILALLPQFAVAKVSSGQVEAKALFEVLYSLQANNANSVLSSLTNEGETMILNLKLGKKSNAISCTQITSNAGENVHYTCATKAEIELPTD